MEAEGIPRAKRGANRYWWPDYLQLIIALVVATDGAVWAMDQGIPTEAVSQAMRESDRPVRYLVGTPRAKMRKMDL